MNWPRHQPTDQAAAYDEDALAKGLVSGDLAQTFNAISDALRAARGH